MVVVDVTDTPFSVTDQLVPEGNPVSVNVTEYVTNENGTGTETGAPLTVNEPEEGEGE